AWVRTRVPGFSAMNPSAKIDIPAPSAPIPHTVISPTGATGGGDSWAWDADNPHRTSKPSRAERGKMGMEMLFFMASAPVACKGFYRATPEKQPNFSGHQTLKASPSDQPHRNLIPRM